MADSPWLTVGVVTSYMEDDPGSTPPAPEERPALLLACNAAAAFVEGKHPGHFTADAVPVYAPPADIKLGAIMLAARLYARRGSTLGTAGYTEFGPTEILRHDPDVARLLKLGTFAPFGFGAPTPTTDGTTTA